MVTIIHCPGIEDEYVFARWDEARFELEARHGGLSSGMLANCREIELTTMAERLNDVDADYAGREFNRTALAQRQAGANTLCLDGLSGEEADLRQVLRLAPTRWAKWYFVDAVGNASLLCWKRWRE